MTNPKEELPAHTPFTKRGEGHSGKEAGRETGTRTARDATGINPKAEDPIDPSMPHMPPA